MKGESIKKVPAIFILQVCMAMFLAALPVYGQSTRPAAPSGEPIKIGGSTSDPAGPYQKAILGHYIGRKFDETHYGKRRPL
jgi:hypothetical protein